MELSALACCGGGRPRSVGACVVRQWNSCCWQRMAGVSQSLTWTDGCISGASGLCTGMNRGFAKVIIQYKWL